MLKNFLSKILDFRTNELPEYNWPPLEISFEEEKLGKGAVVTPTIKKMPTLPRAGAPFDWNTGYSVAELVTKNQNGSGSCGGQAVAYKGEAETGVPKSARFPYCQVFVNGGGSGEGDLIKIIVTEGLADEAVFPSYEAGNQPPSEIFMEVSSDITPAVLANAQSVTGTPVYVDLSFEGIAEAVRDNGGIIIGIAGTNNGTWLSADPLPPKDGETKWYHWLFVGKALMRNGRKVIAVKNSWGSIGENGTGWQYLTEDYLPFIFTAWTFQKAKYVFNNNLHLGSSGEDVFALQARLGIKPTGWFGPISMQAVIAYQKAHNISPALGFCGPITRQSLNSA